MQNQHQICMNHMKNGRKNLVLLKKEKKKETGGGPIREISVFLMISVFFRNQELWKMAHFHDTQR